MCVYSAFHFLRRASLTYLPLCRCGNGSLLRYVTRSGPFSLLLTDLPSFASSTYPFSFRLNRRPPQPHLDEVRFIGSVPTPWHSWVLVATPSTTAPSSPLLPILDSFLTNLTASIHSFDAATARETTSKEFIKGHFGYPEEDVKAWLEQVSYPKGDVREVDKAMVEKTLKYVSFASSVPAFS